MKKAILSVLAVLLFTLTSCGNNINHNSRSVYSSHDYSIEFYRNDETNTYSIYIQGEDISLNIDESNVTLLPANDNHIVVDVASKKVYVYYRMAFGVF